MIIPAILTSNKRIATERLNLAREMSGWVHIDLLDDTLYPFDSLPFDEITVLDTYDLLIEVHCMTENPSALAQSDYLIDRCIMHYETPSWEQHYIKLINEGIDVWLAIDPTTKIEEVNFPDDLTGVVIMGVEPGQTGQEFLSQTYDRLEYLTENFPNLSITVDGGVSKENIRMLLAHGADNLIMGSAIFHQINPVQAYTYYEHLSDPIGGVYDFELTT